MSIWRETIRIMFIGLGLGWALSFVATSVSRLVRAEDPSVWQHAVVAGHVMVVTVWLAALALALVAITQGQKS